MIVNTALRVSCQALASHTESVYAGRMPLCIAGRSFPTKKALEEVIRAIVAHYPDNVPVDPDVAEFLLALFAYHREAPQKFGPGIAEIYVRSNLPYYNTRGFWVRRVDGTETDISWTKCLTPSDPRKDAKKAARAAVQDQIDAFRSEALRTRPICALTGVPVAPGNAHVDHAEPTFDEIFQAFFGALIPEVNPTSDGGVVTEFADPAVAREFAAYHRRVARLRLTSQHANLSRPRRRGGR